MGLSPLIQVKKIYQGNCATCHDSGAAGAPIIGNQADWNPRIKQNMDILFQHAIYGYKLMPSKGMCVNCTDADIKAAVKYMIKTTYPNSNDLQ